MMRFVVAASLAFVLAACVTTPVSGPSEPSGPSTIPSGDLSLGDWRNASEAATLTAFSESVSSRYGAGLGISAVAGDLRRNEFTCSPAPAADRGRGDPPAQVCRRTTTVSGCTHTWQVHLFDEGGNARLARTRGLYDRRCGGDGLLGGPG